MNKNIARITTEITLKNLIISDPTITTDDGDGPTHPTVRIVGWKQVSMTDRFNVLTRDANNVLNMIPDLSMEDIEALKTGECSPRCTECAPLIAAIEAGER